MVAVGLALDPPFSGGTALPRRELIYAACIMTPASGSGDPSGPSGGRLHWVRAMEERTVGTHMIAGAIARTRANPHALAELITTHLTRRPIRHAGGRAGRGNRSRVLSGNAVLYREGVRRAPYRGLFK